MNTIVLYSYENVFIVDKIVSDTAVPKGDNIKFYIKNLIEYKDNAMTLGLNFKTTVTITFRYHVSIIGSHCNFKQCVAGAFDERISCGPKSYYIVFIYIYL